MGEAADRIVADIADARGAINRDLAALGRRARQEMDWRRQARRHPWALAVLVACAVLGVFLSVKVWRD